MVKGGVAPSQRPEEEAQSQERGVKGTSQGPEGQAYEAPRSTQILRDQRSE